MNRTKIEFLPKAEQDLDEIVAYYNQIEKQLAKKFLEDFWDTINLIELYPESWKNISSRNKKAILKNFPYNILYHLTTEKILIVAVYHFKRKPSKFSSR